MNSERPGAVSMRTVEYRHAAVNTAAAATECVHIALHYTAHE